jgi:hypothetical protein
MRREVERYGKMGPKMLMSRGMRNREWDGRIIMCLNENKRVYN